MEQRILEQGSRLGAWGAVSGWAALRWRGAAYFDGEGPDGSPLPVPLVVGRARIARDPRVEISEAQLAPTEFTVLGGLRCTTTQRALFDAMRTAPSVAHAVVSMDMAAAAGLISVRLMSRYVAVRPAWTGVQRVRDALALASDHSRSPSESWMRLTWRTGAGLPPPLCNQPVFSRGGTLLGYPDLLDVEAGVVGEYDGHGHRSADQHRSDVDREARFRDHGLEYFTVVAGQLARERSRVIERMRRTRARARFLPPGGRAWTLAPPPWWRVGDDLDTHLVRTGEAPYLVRC